jgi:hypothetical protein
MGGAPGDFTQPPNGRPRSGPLAPRMSGERTGERIPRKKISRLEPLNLKSTVPVCGSPGGSGHGCLSALPRPAAAPPLPRRGCGTKPQVALSFGATWGNDAALPQPQRGCASGGPPETPQAPGEQPGSLYMECSVAGMRILRNHSLRFAPLKFKCVSGCSFTNHIPGSWGGVAHLASPQLMDFQPPHFSPIAWPRESRKPRAGGSRIPVPLSPAPQIRAPPPGKRRRPSPAFDYTPMSVDSLLNPKTLQLLTHRAERCSAFRVDRGRCSIRGIKGGAEAEFFGESKGGGEAFDSGGAGGVGQGCGGGTDAGQQAFR